MLALGAKGVLLGRARAMRSPRAAAPASPNCSPSSKPSCAPAMALTGVTDVARVDRSVLDLDGRTDAARRAGALVDEAPGLAETAK